MISLLQRIVDAFACWVQKGLTWFANALIAALGALWETVVELLPDMPDLPDLPSVISTGFAWVNWALPFAWFMAYVVSFFTLVVAMLAVMTLLRWLRVVE